MKLDIVIFGLAITSSWGNGHAVTYRALAKALRERGHNVTFLERDTAWYRAHRDFDRVDYCDIALYRDLREIPARFGARVMNADLVILGSYVPDGTVLAEWITAHARGVTAFYDIDTPVTLAGFETGATAYMAAALVPRFDLYLSFTGGPVLHLIEEVYGARRARALHCAADLDVHQACELPSEWELGYLGTYSADRQDALERFMFAPARELTHQKFAVAGAQYPDNVEWPVNVARIPHLPPSAHRSFYGRQRYTLNLTRADMIAAGYSPSVRLFEAAACGVPIISDNWAGLETFFTPGREILVVDQMQDVMHVLSELPEERRRTIAAAARNRLLKSHTPRHRAEQIENYYREVVAEQRPQIREVVA
ncbi:glycosyltransferase [Xanthobacteraceae bacterium Astr-EGSB]|uniref:CgeB family protein n=1 Tax=Astrobacterium formosum TaxID=3069710 RepID=UPI0027B01E18|nr:glycosyltransferase [Xanthobacteraceae bacterium Astr-EGSB]